MTLLAIAIRGLQTAAQIMTGTKDIPTSDHVSPTMTTGTALVIVIAGKVREMSALVSNQRRLQLAGKEALVRSASGWRLLRL